ncbi:beta-N-acetylglucosaminidase domain-containing protein [Streptomyces sp. LP05-1]|uniref:Beta-N-acetylglucosaminidase domain-containing protein n=1 Tax=Streptomyces pyxinae TaxID=2970734 RepID=A0ABT2CMP2_9ACTN|nr:beta-N-acetylglucosaminidase domain-containing protein [Streptomyces sp. LP05-1]MCS0638580.1 beta-N-acetylglucosaminidase domain-containing protein [Streptomyces sp. LP05-1]
MGSERGKRTATAVAVAVFGGLLSGAGATAAPGEPAGSGTAPAEGAAAPPPATAPPAATPLGGVPSPRTAPAAASPAVPAPGPSAALPATRGGLPAVFPRPQSYRPAGSAVALHGTVRLVVDPDADPYAVAALEETLRGAGVRAERAAAPGEGTGPVILAGGTAARDALRGLRAAEPGDLPAGGYRIATGRYANRPVVALDGVGADGLFHAVQTLRRLIADRSVPGVRVRDWPTTAVRGVTEGFYGRPWSHQERLAQLDFLGATKQNRYLYAPGDDPYRQARWRDAYPATQRTEFRELAARARANHVTLAWSVAPAQSMCLASDDDVRALKRKVDAMYALGVRAFQLQFQDASYDEWHCSRDADTFGSGPEAAARAHARVADELARHLAARHPDAGPLSLMPTEYYQDGTTAYRTALAGALDDAVQVAWTGVGVVPRTITGRELAGARDALGGHPLMTMDNYPVNDYEQSRLFLGAYTGREPAVAAGSVALLANAMEQATASRVPLFTAADYAWNPQGYRAGESWQAALTELAGGDPAARAALHALAGNDSSSILDPGAESAYLRPLLDAFWRTRSAGPGGAPARDRAAHELRAAFTVMREAPERLAGTAGGHLDDEVRPWLDQLSRYGRAGELAVDLLQAQSRNDGPAAWGAALELEPLRTALAAAPVKVGTGVLDPFLARTARAAAEWTGAARERAGTVERDRGSYTLRFGRPRALEAVTAMTVPGPGTGGGAVEAYLPGRGWRTLGPLAASGWTQPAVRGLRAEALRVTWTGGDPAAVRALVPWFADEPAATVAPAHEEVEAVIGGPPVRADLTVTARRAGGVRGPVTVQAPPGLRITAPRGEVTVERGPAVAVPVSVTVPAGTPAGEYLVTVGYAGERRTVTVRAYPPAGGPDLARTGTATSSGDETDAFPARAALDGDPATRWSSPAEDDAWWQVELPAPVRLGQVVLRWQDAYAAKYRVQVSADGRTWRTAAAVRDGGGGREALRMDAPGTRFVRVQGDARATRFGYSLHAVELYAVTPPRTSPASPPAG